MSRRDHRGTPKRISIGTIILLAGMALVVLGIGGLTYRQIDSDGGAEAEALSTPTATSVSPTPDTRADSDQQPSPTLEPTASSTPTVRAPSTPTPSPSPTQATTPTAEQSPTPGATQAPAPTSTPGQAPTQSAEPPVQAPPVQPPPVPAPPEAPADDSPNGSTVTHIQLPAAGIYAPVVEIGYNLIDIGGQTVIQWNVAEWAAGHHSISANPGDGGNIVIAGHVAGAGEVFRNLEYAEIGNEVILSTTEGERRYVIEEVHLRLEQGASLEERLAIGSFMAPMPEERLTLITCWPYGVYDHRLIVVAKPA